MRILYKGEYHRVMVQDEHTWEIEGVEMFCIMLNGRPGVHLHLDDLGYEGFTSPKAFREVTKEEEGRVKERIFQLKLESLAPTKEE